MHRSDHGRPDDGRFDDTGSTHRSRGVRIVIVLTLFVATAAFVTACSDEQDARSDGVTTTAQDDTDDLPTTAVAVERFAPEDDGFYDLPDPLPAGRHGDLLRIQPVPGAPDGASWQRIMYRSASVSGEPIAVTGVVTLPDTEPPPGGWPLVAHAHGTTGIANVCAPSVSLSAGGTYATEIALLSNSVASDGFALVSTDYEGLGVKGRHPYLVGESAGRSVLDSLLAARQLPDVDASGPVGIVGYSLGGHAAAWANQLASGWAPGLDIVGVLAGAPASEVPEFVAADPSATRPLLQARTVLVASGLAATGDAFDLEAALSDAGLGVLDQLDERCDPDLPAGEPLTRVDLAVQEPWAGALRANVPGAIRGAAPVLIVHSRTDIVIPIAQGEALAARLCRAGQVVEMRELPDGEHVPTAVAAYRLGLAWIRDLMRGETPVSTCT